MGHGVAYLGVLSTFRAGNQQATRASVIVLAKVRAEPWLIDRAEPNPSPSSSPRKDWPGLHRDGGNWYGHTAIVASAIVISNLQTSHSATGNLVEWLHNTSS